MKLNIYEIHLNQFPAKPKTNRSKMTTSQLIKSVKKWMLNRDRHQLDNSVLIQVVTKLEKLHQLEQQANGFLVSK